jgi:hypothetical protein
MFAPLPRQGPHPQPAARKAAARLRRLGAFMAAMAFGLLALAAGSPAMAATVSVPHYGPSVPVPPAQVPAPIHIVTAGGMPGWQIALIAVAAALIAAALAVLADRVLAPHRHAAPAAH